MTNILGALEKLYKELGFENPDVLSDIKHDYLTECTTRHGKTVLWYLDECHNIAIDIESLELFTQEDIEQGLC